MKTLRSKYNIKQKRPNKNTQNNYMENKQNMFKTYTITKRIHKHK